ncbi:MAG: lytic transglycosylase domain-containing protein [Alphaproteobacteria bacterium]|nr:lytic transglycosylase domain-containing protein [Alphaproteobacteria bacterium]MDP6567705.1 lytic transglycosylase domain-containing protein [Alphaproteobacteria bacterium]
MKWRPFVAVAAGSLAMVLLAGPAAAAAIHATAPGHAGGGLETAALSPANAAEAADIDLPRILRQADRQRYRRIFALQESGDWMRADQLIRRLDDPLLLGHVLFQRYMHPTKYRSRYKELRGWLDRYADHPGATRIHRLAQRRRPKGARAPKAPSGPRTARGYADIEAASQYQSPRRRSAAQRRLVRRIQAKIRRNVRHERLTVSQKYLDRKDVRRLLDPVERDELLARVAAAWYYRGNDGKAYALAAGAADRTPRYLSNTHWIAGLAAWRLGRIEVAAGHFEALAVSPVADSWNAAAGAFWAARANLIARRPDKVNPLLEIAAQHPRTFYGLIASRQLGVDLKLHWATPPLTSRDLQRVGDLDAVRRAVALVEVGRPQKAEQEIRRAYLSTNPLSGPALLALAHKMDLPAMQMRLARGVRNASELLYDQALFPLPPWRPERGFAVDRALLFAVMRQESGFNTRARSPMGARGLMQLMPRTASYVTGDRSLRRGNRTKLYDPEFNLALGQKYLSHLLRQVGVKGDLFRLVVAYNAGPGNLRKWLRKVTYKGDPLLFIESLPSRETRLFVERVLTNFWIYRERLQQDTPSLDAAATGHWPVYLTLDANTIASTRHGRN